METGKKGIIESEKQGSKGNKGNGDRREAKERASKVGVLNRARGRTDSLGTLSEYIQKRKREGAEEEIAKAEREILEKFKETGRVNRSPPNKIKKEERRESEMAEEMFKEILKKLEEQEKERRKDKEEIKEEIKELKEEFKKREEAWEQQKSRLQERIRDVEEKVKNMEMNEARKGEEGSIVERVKEMERTIEIAERKRRRNNIIVKGEYRGNETEKKEIIERMMNEAKMIKMAVEQVQNIGYGENKMTLIKCKSWEAKREIMKKRKELGKEYRIYLDDDLTKMERQIQKEIRKRAKEERQAGKKVTIRYQRMWVDDKEMKWDERKGKLEERSSFRK